MRRIKLVLGLVAVMVAVMVVLAAPAMAKKGGNNGGNSGISFNNGGSSFNSGGSSFNSGGGDFDGSSFLSSGGSSWGWGSWDDDAFFGDFDVEQEAVSGDIDFDTEIDLSGDNSNQSAPVVQFGNTGNVQNAQTFSQFDSEAEDFEIEGGFISFDPEFEFASDQEIEQASAA